MKSILIADDDRDLVHAISRRLMHRGFRVTAAHDALSALILIKRDRPDLVVLDIHMPAGNGMCVLEMIRSEPQWEDIPVVVVSGEATPAMIRRVHNDHTAFVAKSEGMWPRLEERILSMLNPLDVVLR
ncbi:MAG: response regulator [Pirellulaceae bacterium]